MPLTKVDTWNMALGHLGNSNRVVLDTDTTTAAKACALFWDTVIDDVLRAVAWPFALKIVALAGKAAAPNIEWLFSYTYPADAITIRRVVDSLVRLRADKSTLPFRRTAALVFTDQDNALAEYTVRITDPSLWPADFAYAVSLLLAYRIAPTVAGGSQWKMADRALAQYKEKIQEAAANASAEERDLEREIVVAAKVKEDIVNGALGLLGVTQEVQDIVNERTVAARTARQFYSKTVDQVFRDFDWPWARKTLALTLVEADPTEEWGYSYTYPADAVAVRRVLNGSQSRTETETTRTHFTVANKTNRVIMTDQATAVAQYTIRIDDTTLWPADFRAAVEALLASKMAPRLLGIELATKTRAVANMLELYRQALTRAEINAVNESMSELEPDSSLERARQ